MTSYNYTEKKYSVLNLLSLLEYVGVVIRAWHECASDNASQVIMPTQVLQSCAEDILEYYVSKSEDCGQHLPHDALACASMRELKDLYDRIDRELHHPGLSHRLQYCAVDSGVSLLAAHNYLRML